MHQRPWSVWAFASFCAISRSCLLLYGHGIRHRLHSASRAGGVSMPKLTALLAGLTFGLGLYLSGMTDPMKVLAFLDLAGDWDPSLAFVMIGAIALSSFPFHLAKRRQSAFLGGPIQIPTSRIIDRRLVLGSMTFGVGWGIAGLCPGPALALLLSGRWEVITFCFAMAVGMLVFNWVESRFNT